MSYHADVAYDPAGYRWSRTKLSDPAWVRAGIVPPQLRKQMMEDRARRAEEAKADLSGKSWMQGGPEAADTEVHPVVENVAKHSPGYAGWKCVTQRYRANQAPFYSDWSYYGHGHLGGHAAAMALRKAEAAEKAELLEASGLIGATEISYGVEKGSISHAYRYPGLMGWARIRATHSPVAQPWAHHWPAHYDLAYPAVPGRELPHASIDIDTAQF